MNESLKKAPVTPDSIMARAQFKANRLKAKGWTSNDFLRVLIGGPSSQKEVWNDVQKRRKDVAESVVYTLLEYGKIDYGQDEYGRTRWQVSSDNYWISPEGRVIRVPAHRAWALKNVLPQGTDPEFNIYAQMKALGWIRATVERNTFYVNAGALNPRQQEAVDDFAMERHYEVQNMVIA